ncbi:hypothetical protein I6H67_03965 [Pediococcus pentosaceus]|uniref:hypothetical protein n=1 Tax=Pediococcus pentosaceus TaxID=1255 RepID=UPI0018E17B25|nr:hypothetical protein [Pediococcus pentosaceus]MBF7104601.1 hypothetical protein [Pediococcus pentosaceus]QQC62014.1 hypothetical protein I6H67_03965 [Pediococcus pentosaceus]
MKDNSFVFNANMKKVTLDKNGVQALLTVEDTEFLEVATQLANTAGYDVVVKIIPAQTVLDAEPQETKGQAEMFE